MHPTPVSMAVVLMPVVSEPFHSKYGFQIMRKKMSCEPQKYPLNPEELAHCFVGRLLLAVAFFSWRCRWFLHKVAAITAIGLVMPLILVRPNILLDQINAENFSELEIAWRWDSIDAELDLNAALGPDGDDLSFGRLQATPLMIDGVVYMITGLNQVAALAADTGELIWSFDPQAYLSGNSISPLGYHHRGVAYWSDEDNARILFATNDGYLFSLNAITGEPRYRIRRWAH